MRERRALRQSGGAAGELDIDRIVGIERSGKAIQTAALSGSGERQQRRERPGGAWQRAIIEHYDVLEMRQPRRAQRRGVRGDFRRQRTQHVDVVARFVARRHYQRLAGDLVERVLELGRAISRVDIDQDRADARGAELHVEPLGAIGCPDADPIAAADPERQKTGGDRIGALAQLIPGQPGVVRREDRSGAAAVARAGAVEKLRDGHELEWIGGRSGDIGERALRPQMLVIDGDALPAAPAAQKIRGERIVAVRQHRRPLRVNADQKFRQSPSCSKA